MNTRSLLAAVMLMLLCEASSPAADHRNTDEGFPIQVEDAYPVDYRAVDVQFVSRFEDLRGGGSRWVLAPEVEAGLLLNTEVRLSGNLLINGGDESSSAELGVLYNFNTETITTPAVAIVGLAEFDFGGAPDFTARGIVTRSCGASRFNFNGDYIIVGSPGSSERGNRYRLGLGWDRLIRLDMLLLADIVTTASRLRGDSPETIIEAGIRYQLDPTMVLGAGIGIGLSGGDGSRTFTATLGFARSL